MTRTHQITFEADIPKNTADPNPVEVSRDMPAAGTVTKIAVGWPNTEAAVGISFRRGTGESLFPSNTQDQYVAMPAPGLEPFEINAEVSYEETLTAVYTNSDGSRKYATLVATLRPEQQF